MLMTKAALQIYVIWDDVQAAVGPDQLCAGQIAGMEAVVHAVRLMFDHDDSDTILLVDATNAFNHLVGSLAMLMHAFAMIPLIHHLTSCGTQVQYVIDTCACGRLSDLHQWWNQLFKI